MVGSKRKIHTYKVCVHCKHKRWDTAYLTSSGRQTKVCQKCRDEHKKDVRLTKGASTALRVRTLRTIVECEKCGYSLPVGEMHKHRRACLRIEFGDIPGLVPEGETAE